jgi:hypothetical protein
MLSRKGLSLSRGYRRSSKLGHLRVGAGNEFGLVYYCVAFLVLAFLFATGLSS